MDRLIRAELMKLRTTQVWLWLLLAAVAISALLVIAPIAAGDVNNSEDLSTSFGLATSANLVLFVLGVLGVTTEFRHQTITPTVLATPSRWRLISAKMITYALVGLVYAAVCVIIQLLIAIPWLKANGTHFSLSEAHIPRVLVAVFVVLALYGIIGLGVGALLKNQIVAVSVGVIFLALIQNIFSNVPGVKHVYPYLPGGATQAVAAVKASDRVNDGVQVLPVAGGIVVLLLWAFIPAIIGASLTLNRDIT